jgi:hypothetical protein
MLSVVGFSSLEPVPRFALNFKPGKPPRPNDGVLKYTSPRRKFVLSRTQRFPRARGCKRQSKSRPRHAMRVGDAAAASAGPAHPPRTYRGDERRELPPQAEQTQTEICTCPLTRDLASLRWRPAASSPHPCALPERPPSSLPETRPRSSRPIALRQVHRQIVRLAFHSGHDHPGFSEVRLRFSRSVPQRHQHLPGPYAVQTHIVFHDRVAARVDVLSPAIEYPLRRVPLFDWLVFIFFQNGVDDANPRP